MRRTGKSANDCARAYPATSYTVVHRNVVLSVEGSLESGWHVIGIEVDDCESFDTQFADGFACCADLDLKH